MLSGVGTGVQMNLQFVEGAQDQTDFGTRMTSLDLDHPLAANANASSQRRLIELETLALMADDSAVEVSMSMVDSQTSEFT